MDKLNLFAYGWLNPILAFATSTLGCLLAILLAIKARGHAGRGRLLASATVALGGIGVFQAHLLAILGFGLRDGSVHYALLTMLVSLGAAVVPVAGGLFLVSLDRPGAEPLTTASALIGIGVTAGHYVAVNGVRGTGYLYYEPVRFIGSVAIAMLAGMATMWFIVSARGLRSAVLGALIAGAGICGMHYAAMSTLRAQPSLLVAVNGSEKTAGLPPMALIGPAVLLGVAATSMLWYFTVGTSTVREMKAIFENSEHPVEIEPWLIEEVTRRVALGYGTPDSPLVPNGAAAHATTAGDITPNVTTRAITAPGITADDTGRGISVKGFTAREATANGASPNGATANGTTANGASPNGATANGTTANGASPNGATANGTTAPRGIPRNDTERRITARDAPAHRATRTLRARSAPAMSPVVAPVAPVCGEPRVPAVESSPPNAGPTKWPAGPDRYPPGYTCRNRNNRHA
jgi:NO-binding membrane sensor protein with MHYT domain